MRLSVVAVNSETVMNRGKPQYRAEEYTAER
jgi:hypothetical protein